MMIRKLKKLILLGAIGVFGINCSAMNNNGIDINKLGLYIAINPFILMQGHYLIKPYYTKPVIKKIKKEIKKFSKIMKEQHENPADDFIQELITVYNQSDHMWSNDFKKLLNLKINKKFSPYTLEKIKYFFIKMVNQALCDYYGIDNNSSLLHRVDAHSLKIVIQALAQDFYRYFKIYL